MSKNPEKHTAHSSCSFCCPQSVAYIAYNLWNAETAAQIQHHAHRDCAQLTCVCYIILNTSVLVALDVVCKNKNLKDGMIGVFPNPRKSKLPSHNEKRFVEHMCHIYCL